MKKLLTISLLYVLTIPFSLGQGWVTNGAKIVLTDSVFVVITTPSGNYMNKGAGMIYSKNRSQIHLRGNWYNNGSTFAIGSNDGSVILDGGGQLIGGITRTSFNNLTLTGNGNKDILVNTLVGGGQLGAKSGLLNLTNKNLYLNSNTLIVNNDDPSCVLRSSGLLIGETGPGPGYGYVQWTCRNASSGTKYSIPFGSTDLIEVPFGIDIDRIGISTRDSGFFKIAMYPTASNASPNNRPLPNGVMNLNNEFGLENDVKSVDRYFIVESGGYGIRPSTKLHFPYIDREWDLSSGSRNDIIEKQLRAVRYDFRTDVWLYPGGGNADVAGNKVSYDVGNDYRGEWVLFNWPSCPNALFDYNEVCEGELVRMVNKSTILQGTIDSVVWNVNGRQYVDMDTVDHLFPSDGFYDVLLQVKSDRGCWDTITNRIAVHPNPIADFEVKDTCLGELTVFTNFSSSKSGNPMFHNWSVDGTRLGGGRNFDYVFPDTGNYEIKLHTTNSWGCVDSTVRSTRIYPLPIANFDVEDICEGDVAEFFDRSVSESPITNWTWSLNGNIFSHDQNSVRLMSNRGVYPIKLEVTNTYECYDTIVKNFIVKPRVEAGFTVWPGKILISDPLVKFTETSSDASEFIWDFGDGSPFSHEANPDHEYQDTGSYLVQQIANNDEQCPDTAYRRIWVGPDLRIWIPNAFTPGGPDNRNETFKPVGITHALDGFYMEIYNRWGELLYVTDDINKPWDGSYRGELVEQDNYLYLIKVIDIYRNEEWYKGIVTVLR